MNLAAALKLLDDSDFIRLYPFPMEVPDDCVHVSSVDIKRDSIFFAGLFTYNDTIHNFSDAFIFSYLFPFLKSLFEFTV